MRPIIFILSLIVLLFVVVMVASGVRSEWNRHLSESDVLSQSHHAELVVLGNSTCPVSGDKVKEGFYVNHQNQKIGLCCPSCKKYFQRDPGKYL